MFRIIIISVVLLNTIVLLNAADTPTNGTATKQRSSKVSSRFKDSKISRIVPLPIDTAFPSMSVAPHERSFPINYHRDDPLMKPHDKHNLKKFKNQKKGNSLKNAELLEQLGLSKLQVPLSQHRKRLAVESRHHGRPDDSHMFVIKLPPNPYYYGNDIPNGNSKNSITDHSQKIPVGFKSNGKPGRIYHWNIPVLKKMFGTTSGRNPNSRHSDDDSEFFDIKDIPTWSKPWDNEAIDKQPAFGKLSKDEEKILKKKSPTYYAPKPRKSNVHKYFPGNGKPKSFYVIEKSHKPAYYQKLIP